MNNTVQYLKKVSINFEKLLAQTTVIDKIAEEICLALQKGNKVIFCGNGGSASDSQHLAAELLGRFLFDRASLPGISLTANTSTITAIGNDYGYEQIFSRQLEGVGKKGDVLFCLSTSGNSKNIILAIEKAKQQSIKTVGLTGAGGGLMKDICDHLIAVPSSETNHIQEMHIAVGHIICGIIESKLCQPK